ncbi:MAG: CDP-alcohol phosphatidyltransferase family protein [Sulfuriferula sp.]|nr:CDP-alcohol phosphatidyltransferase family protein [Sulfuriferula sp.]
MPNVPNTISLFRLLLVPLVVYLLAISAYGYALAVFLTASVSDGIDGWIARHYDLRTAIGAILDPVADKLVILACLLMLTWHALIPLWLTLSLLARDLIIVVGAMAYRRLTGHLQVTPTLLGKIHIFMEFGMLCLVLADAAGIVSLSLQWLFMLVLATAVLSGLHYVWIWTRKAARFLAGKSQT